MQELFWKPQEDPFPGGITSLINVLAAERGQEKMVRNL